MTKMIVGVEDSVRSRDAVVFARHLAADTKAQIVLATVYGPGRIPSYAAGPRLEEHLRADAEATLVRMRREAADVCAETLALHDASPARALQRLAREEEAALIVIGSSARGEVGRVFAGTTAERLLHGSPCPVVVVPDDFRFRAGTIRRILVAYDGSPEARFALTTAMALGRSLGAGVSVFQAVVPTYPGAVALVASAAYLVPPAELAREARARLDADLGALQGGDRVAAEVSLGDPVTELAKRSKDADLLVMGSRGYGPHRAVLLGSVSGRLVRESASPVLVVPRGGHAHVDELVGAGGAVGTA